MTDHGEDVQALAQRLLQVKSIFPGADAAQIFLQHPLYMLKQDTGVIRAAADRLRDLIPDVDVDKCAAHTHNLITGNHRQVSTRQLIASVSMRKYQIMCIAAFTVACVYECRLVEEHPQLLDVEGFELALSHARETLPSLDVGHMMRYNPSMIFGFQRGAQLIPYDEVPTST